MHNFRLFDAFLAPLFDFDGFVADDVVSLDSLEDAPFTEVDDAVLATATLDGDGAAASKTMTSSLLLRSSEEAGTLLPLPSAFIVVAFCRQLQSFRHGTSLLVCRLFDVVSGCVLVEYYCDGNCDDA